MRIHVVMHVPFEEPFLIEEWAAARGHSVTRSLALTEEYPEVDSFEMLVIMGGPMDADDDAVSPWLTVERRFIGHAINERRLVLGVCLGSQILADVLGGSVARNTRREIGYYPVRLTDAGAADPLFDGFPAEAVVGHWHGDTFVLPAGVRPALSSDLTPNQAFTAEDGRVLALQCHLEWTEAAIEGMIAACHDDLTGADGVADAAAMRAGIAEHGASCRALLFGLLDRFTASVTETEARS